MSGALFFWEIRQFYFIVFKKTCLGFNFLFSVRQWWEKDAFLDLVNISPPSSYFGKPRLNTPWIKMVPWFGLAFFWCSCTPKARGAPAAVGWLCSHPDAAPTPCLLCWGLVGKGPLPKPSLKHSPLLPGIFRVKKALSQGGKNPSNSPGGVQGMWESGGQRQSSGKSVLITCFLTPKWGWWGWGAGRASGLCSIPLRGWDSLGRRRVPSWSPSRQPCPAAHQPLAAALPWHRVQTVPEAANIQLEWPRQKHSVCL